DRLDTAKRAAEAEFPGRFAALRAQTIRPALQEFVDVLSAHCYESAIGEQDESSTTTGGVSLAAISLHVIPRSSSARTTEASKTFVDVTFSANRNERKVIVSSTNTMMHSNGAIGKRGEYELESLTAEVVAKHVLETLQDALR
ncbi:MAG: hypothetical protein ACRENE_33400, partial [Polyangiaceae bacterium]